MKKCLKFSLSLLFLVVFLFPVLAQDMNPNLPPYDQDLLWERDFNDGTCYPWHNCEDSGGVCTFDVVDNAADSNVPVGFGKAFRLEIKDIGENRWSVQMRHRGITLVQGHTYTVRFKVWSDVNTSVYAKIGMMGDPYAEYWNNNWKEWALPAGEIVEVVDTFKMTDPTDQTCEFTFHGGGMLGSGGAVPYYIYLDDVSLSDEDFIKVYPEVIAEPDVRVNQIGYFPQGNKKATVLSESTSPIEWMLLNAAGVKVDGGLTEVYGLDTDSQDYVHKIDFSNFTTEGMGYKFFLPDSTSKTNYSHPFDIRDDLYSQMKFEALQYFYHNRSGIELVMPYAGREDLTRPAGHLDVAPNTGDSAVPTGPGQPSYSLDLTGGWYDAGDHGKYVVNGGIALWTMLNQYERAVVKGLDGEAPYKDGGMNIPENGNGVPDILDEAKWEMDWIMKMQVPASKDPDHAGMAHHKMGDEVWTALAVRPHEDPIDRIIHPVSTAATLNLAATAAQASRIWRSLGDDAYADKCLDSAERAWAGAVANPELYAPNVAIGTGPYNDNYVLDEFYWAACELYITTGKAVYKDYLTASPHYLEMPARMEGTNEDDGLYGVFTWGTTQGLGTVSLALLPNGLADTEIEQAKANMTASCEVFLQNIEDQGYGLPIKQGGPEGGYPWGSNSFIVNIMMVMGYAYDYTGDAKYLAGITESMDYLMGRNALDQSYVTGYGERALINPHHRFWSYQISDEFPLAPAGCFSGGPNSHFQDPTINAYATKDTPVQKVFVDHIESWSTNEITVNWNAPFAWITSFLDEQADSEKVRITSPEAGSKYEVGANITIDASVSTMESVSSVKFYNGTVLLGTDTSAPYSYTISGAAIGAYELTAVATCASGKVITSPVTPVIVKEIVKPTAQLLSPEAGGFLCHAEVIVELVASASDVDGVVEDVFFKVGGEVYKAKYDEEDGLYKYNWKSVEGTHTISAYATDDDQAVSDDSNAVDVLIKPAKNLIVQYACREKGDSVSTVRGKLNIINKGTKPASLEGVVVRYYWTNDYPSKDLRFACHHSQTVQNVSASFGSTEEYDYMELSFGSHVIEGVSETGEIQFDFNYPDYVAMNQADDYSYDGTIGEYVNYEKMALYKNGELLWGTPPSTEPYLNISLASPADGTVLTEGVDNTINISAVIDTNIDTVSAVSFYNGTELLGTDSAAPYTYSIENAAVGTYNIKAEITAEGTVYSSAVSTVEVIEFVEILEINITAPANNSVVVLGESVTVSVAVNTNINGAPAVTFYYNNEVIGQDSSAPFTASFTPAAAGPGTITAEVNAAGSVESDSVSIEVKELIKPVVAVSSPVNGESFEAGQSVALAADASDADGTVVNVEFYVDGNKVSGDVWTAAGAGDHVITAVATDNDGLSTTSAPVTIEVIDNGSGSIDVALDINAWNNGFSGNLNITNNSDSAVNGWTLEFDLADGMTVSSYWCCRLEIVGNHVTITPLDWNKQINPGGTISVGFSGNHNGTYQDPINVVVTPNN